MEMRHFISSIEVYDNLCTNLIDYYHLQSDFSFDFDQFISQKQ